MEDLITVVRNHILSGLETGELEVGSRLPGCRELARTVGVSVPTVQNALETLVRDGILETVARRGTFAHAEWTSRLIPGSLFLGFTGHTRHRAGFCDAIKTEIPELWLSNRVKRAIFEIRVSHYIQPRYSEYMDLGELFLQTFPNQDEFFMKPFEAYRVEGRLIGIPLLFSPRVFFYNPALLRRAGCPMPGIGWTWNDFLDCVRKLRKTLPGGTIFDWYNSVHSWMNFVVRAGGCLISPEAADPVQIDSPATRRGLRLFRELRHELWGDELLWQDHFVQDFLGGKNAMMMSTRELIPAIGEAGLLDWGVAPLPLISGGRDANVQAAGLFCVRKECQDLTLAGKLLRFLLSEPFQNRLAAAKYGIPIRKDAAGRSIDFNDPRDLLFFSESSKMHSHYNIDSIDLFNIIRQGVAQLLVSDQDIDAGTSEIANMTRTYLKIKNYKSSPHKASISAIERKGV